MVNKTGTLNTKSVTPSQLATDSPILPHKITDGTYPQPPEPTLPGVVMYQHPLSNDQQQMKIVSTVTPRTRENSINRENGRQQYIGDSGASGVRTYANENPGNKQFQSIKGGSNNNNLSSLSAVKRNSMTRAEGQV